MIMFRKDMYERQLLPIKQNAVTTIMKLFHQKDLLLHPVRILVITDTHGFLPDNIFQIRYLEYDACFLLGDIYQSDIHVLREILDTDKTYGVIGNHNYLSFLKDNGIRDIHGKTVTINGITFAGWGGSLKYKQSIELGFDGKFGGMSSRTFAGQLPKADVLISHDGPFRDDAKTSHSGIRGITEYLRDYHVPLHIHGHLHRNMTEKIGETTSICVFRAAIIDQKGNIKIIC